MRKSKPDILIVLAILIGLGVLVTEVAQAIVAKPEAAATVVSANR